MQFVLALLFLFVDSFVVAQGSSQWGTYGNSYYQATDADGNIYEYISWRYYGCYTGGSGDPLFSNPTKLMPLVTKAVCVQQCWQGGPNVNTGVGPNNWIFAAVNAGYRCFCGNRTQTKPQDVGQCFGTLGTAANRRCAGNTSEGCSGDTGALTFGRVDIMGSCASNGSNTDYPCFEYNNVNRSYNNPDHGYTTSSAASTTTTRPTSSGLLGPTTLSLPLSYTPTTQSSSPIVSVPVSVSIPISTSIPVSVSAPVSVSVPLTSSPIVSIPVSVSVSLPATSIPVVISVSDILTTSIPVVISIPTSIPTAISITDILPTTSLPIQISIPTIISTLSIPVIGGSSSNTAVETSSPVVTSAIPSSYTDLTSITSLVSTSSSTRFQFSSNTSTPVTQSYIATTTSSQGTITSVPSYVAPPGPTPSGTTDHCYEWYTVSAYDTCGEIEEQYSISFTYLQALNPSIDPLCVNLIIGDAYCVNGEARYGGTYCTLPTDATTIPPQCKPTSPAPQSTTSSGSLPPSSTPSSYVTSTSTCANNNCATLAPVFTSNGSICSVVTKTLAA